MADDRVSSSVKILAAVTLAAGALVGAFLWFGAASPRNAVPPEDAARAWAEKLKLPFRGAACTMFDSDGDGYVSCVLALDGPDRVYFQGLQCGEWRSTRAGGCKVDAKNPEVKLAFDLAARTPPPEARAH